MSQTDIGGIGACTYRLPNDDLIWMAPRLLCSFPLLLLLLCIVLLQRLVCKT